MREPQCKECGHAKSSHNNPARSCKCPAFVPQDPRKNEVVRLRRLRGRIANA